MYFEFVILIFTHAVSLLLCTYCAVDLLCLAAALATISVNTYLLACLLTYLLTYLLNSNVTKMMVISIFIRVIFITYKIYCSLLRRTFTGGRTD